MVRTRNRIAVLVIGLGLVAGGCGDDDESGSSGNALTLTSPAFEDGQPLPSEYTCAGKNFPYSGIPPVPHTLPELDWKGGPKDTQSYALVFRDVTLTTGTDIDERGYHWAIWNIPASVESLPKNLSSGNPIPNLSGAQQYSGPLFDDGYVGPCPSWAVAPGAPPPEEGADPPKVKTDSYTFTLYAFPSTLTVPAAPTEMGASYVHVLQDFFVANATATAVLGTTSDAQPAMFAVPPAAE